MPPAQPCPLNRAIHGRDLFYLPPTYPQGALPPSLGPWQASAKEGQPDLPGLLAAGPHSQQGRESLERKTELAANVHPPENVKNYK